MLLPRKFLLIAVCFILSLSRVDVGQAEPEVAMTVENDHAKITVSADGRNVSFVDKRSGADYCRKTPPSPLARVNRGGKVFDATRATYTNGTLILAFGEAGVTAVLKVTAHKRYFEIEVGSVAGEAIDSLVFVDFPLTLKGDPQEPFAACALALNLKTRVQAIPQATSHLWAACYPRFGFVGAKVALIGCPQSELRGVLKEVVTASPDLPHSSIGGPWALDGKNNYGSYLFNTGGLTEETVDEWIDLARSLGITQIDFHGGHSFRFGDFRPNPDLYPRGVASMKTVIDKLHAAGILAGLHTYAMFMDKSCPYVTPVPDPRLGKDATFTLSSDLAADAATVAVVESPEKMHTTTGFFVRNSVTLQIDDELITYAGVSKQPPFAFTQCQRGAYGTKVAQHEQGAKAHHLRECFGLFCPNGDSTLFSEVAAKTAELYNEAGFDMIYLDALDGGDTVAGPENSWHYESKFTFEICKRLKRPAIMEMSTFHHHLWNVRSRMGAWDHPTRSHKKFIDIHCQANDGLRRQFLPGHLGWWAFKTWSGASGEPTYPDDIEYLCAKALGTGNGLSIMGIDPSNRHNIPALSRLSAIVRRYESLRHANYFADSVKEKLRVLGDEYTLFQGQDGEWQFRPVEYARHKVQAGMDWSATWKVKNRFGRQPLRLRIEALMSTGAYDAPGNVTLADFSDATQFPDRAAQPGVSAKLESSTAQIKTGATSGLLTAANTTGTATRSWCKFGKVFSPPVNLTGQQALGVWVYGDSKGEVLNLQQTSPEHLSGGIADHYIVVDFTGWRYFELVEPEGERYADHAWPYGWLYSIYRESIIPSQVQTLSLWLNNLPPKDNVTCYLSPIRALPVVSGKLRNPSVTVNGQTVTFPVEIESGQVLEFRSATDCVVYGHQGEELARVQPQGDVPLLESGENEVKLSCANDAGPNPRANVSVITQGDPVRGVNAPQQVRWEFLRREDDDPRVVRALDGAQNEWDLLCRPDAKKVRLEAEILVESAGEEGLLYSDPNAVALETFDNLDAFADKPGNRYLQYVASGSLKGVPTAPGVTHDLTLSSEVVKRGNTSARYTATSEQAGGWSARGKRFNPLLDLSRCTHAGFLIHGDGNGEILYLQLRDVKGAWHDMKVGIGFTGWKYREFPLAGAKCDLSKIEYLIIYYNALPAGKTCTCYLDDVRAWRDPTFLRNPVLQMGGANLVFPTLIQPGQRLVYRNAADCKLYDVDGKLKGQVRPTGVLPNLKPGRNPLTFRLDTGNAKSFQVRVKTTKVYE